MKQELNQLSFGLVSNNITMQFHLVTFLESNPQQCETTMRKFKVQETSRKIQNYTEDNFENQGRYTSIPILFQQIILFFLYF